MLIFDISGLLGFLICPKQLFSFTMLKPFGVKRGDDASKMSSFVAILTGF